MLKVWFCTFLNLACFDIECLNIDLALILYSSFNCVIFVIAESVRENKNQS